MTYHEKTLTISIVSHLQIDLVFELLNDVEKYSYENINVILTLNLSEELGFQLSGYSFPIKIIKNVNPKGFGANHNQAFKYCDTPYFCVLNPDIRLREDPFKRLLAELEEHSAGLIAPKVINSLGSIEDSVRTFPTPLSILKKLLFKKFSADYATDKIIVNPDWVGGMFMLFRSDAFRQIGGFDERYFLYYEDVDISRTLHQNGKNIIYTPNTAVIHEARRTSHKSIRYLLLHLSSMLRFFIKWLVR
jgi:GT2 family glycosyltransferase